jgi:hypothetical protein
MPLAYSEILAKAIPVTLHRLSLSHMCNMIYNIVAFHFEIIQRDFTLF